jgi:hypothetical protein
LKSLLLSLKSTKPNVVFTKQSMVCEELARAVHKEFSGLDNSNFPAKNEPILLILDRRLDPATPILNQV